LELAHRGETWPQVVWTGYDEARPVWRVEFQFRRRALHEFGVGHVHELLAGRQDLWEYGTRWLSLRRRVPGLRPGRWPEANAWTVIRDARMGSPRSGLVRQRIYEASVERLVRGFVGYSTSLAAAGAIGDVASLIQTVPPAQRYVVHRGMSLDDVIARKRALRLSAQPSFTVGRCQQGDMQGDPDAAAQPPRRGGGGAPYMEPASGAAPTVRACARLFRPRLIRVRGTTRRTSACASTRTLWWTSRSGCARVVARWKA